MYLAHFGLSESPFSLTPDPRYLYLGARHSEGLAHLLFGLSEAGGFVQLTGEIGTGKTTLCRTLLEQLPEAVDVAFILNPRVTDTELLATICTELGITHGPRSWSAAALVDRLHRYLLQAHEHARRTVLVIDEAQNLTNPVLEQVRLLTNLETTRDKLLQIILIGQPELLQLLARHDLRQVAQRITARYHLLPFSRYEAFDYIAHRMRLAGGDAEVFTYPARWVIFRAARGVPRLINVYCDRALLGAYVRERPRVTAGIARRAVREVEGGQLAALRRPRRRWMAAGALGLVLAALGWFYTPSPLLTSVIAGNRPAEPAIRPAPAVPQTAPQPGEDALKLRQFLTRLDTQGDETSALAQLFRRWAIEDASASSCAAAAAHSLACLSGQATWQAIQLLDLPVVLELRHTLGDARYATLTGRGEAGLELAIGAQTSV
ncbi:MAG: ExeA family protein, partial [Gammaproteobacteria bacterium]